MNNDEIIKKLSEIWEEKSKIEPYYSSINDDFYLLKNLNEENKKRFFDTGFNELNYILSIIKEAKINVDIITSMEYGCGIGRVANSFCKKFYHTYAVDLSESYLNFAKEYISLDKTNNIDYIKISNENDIGNLPNVDLIYSVLVLQHNPPPISSIIIEQFCKCINPNGIAIFQVPTYNPYYKFVEKEYLDKLKSAVDVDMHILDQKQVCETIFKNNCKIIEIKKDYWTGRVDDISNTFVIQKESL
jgi:2-polyprenyl-3-methyl-5-hydroxy-6-metoxy-1,4-benzoquinol methylase